MKKIGEFYRMQNKNEFRIRPAGRHLLTIGKDLIKDEHAAIVELVKNAYDADSEDVLISFVVSENFDSFKIIVEDHGHGMSRDDVINKWLVPSTDDKLNRKKTEKRTMQGRKGIGRWSAAILGDDLDLETVTSNGEQTQVLVDWSEFKKAKYLEDVPVLVETFNTSQNQGTKLTINCKPEKISEKIELWVNGNDSGINKLEFELAKLVSPIKKISTTQEIEDDFEIKVNYVNLFEDSSQNKLKIIEPIPLLDSYDYRIHGEITGEGKGELVYSTQKARNTVDEDIEISLNGGSKCGDIIFDIRVYDRDSDSIDELISRGKGLKKSDGSFFGKRETRNLLNEYNGIGVYRHGFRIRPLGDPEFDWLTLNKRRVQNPSMRLGSDQAIGYIHIQAEELSGLEEKSARDGLKDNGAFRALQKLITDNILQIIEAKRFEYRYKENLGQDKDSIQRNLEYLTDFSDIEKTIGNILEATDIESSYSKQIMQVISEKERKQGKLLKQIQKAIAIYQGQATLGKIINVILHEGRKPVGFYINTFPLIEKWMKKWLKKPDEKLQSKIHTALQTSIVNAKTLAGFYRQLDPLASVQRGRKTKMNVKESVEKAVATFSGEFKKYSIQCELSGSDDLILECWPQDIQIILTNLIENSIFWIANSTGKEGFGKITLTINNGTEGFESIDYQDTGTGIPKKYIESQVIFEPGFSTKPKGTGLGLAIAGEAAERSRLKLTALENEGGAYFRLEKDEEKNG